MQSQSFIINKKPESWNKLARKSHWTYTAIFNEWHYVTLAAMRKANIRAVSGPVRIIVLATWVDRRRHDLDNILLKPIFDTLVSDHILSDDTFKIIKEIRILGKNGTKNSLKVTIVAAISGEVRLKSSLDSRQAGNLPPLARDKTIKQ